MTRFGLAMLMVLMFGVSAAWGGPIGPPCNGCSDGFYYNGSGCAECSNGGADYDCGPGSFRSGRACVACSTDADTQTCEVCGNGGADFECPAGTVSVGGPCTGTTDSDTQICANLAPAVSNHNVLFLGAGLLLAGLWSMRRLTRARSSGTASA